MGKNVNVTSLSQIHKYPFKHFPTEIPSFDTLFNNRKTAETFYIII